MSETSPSLAHVHHWVIDPPAGPTSPGRCSLCGEEKLFVNSLPIDQNIWPDQKKRGKPLTAVTGEEPYLKVLS